jgi:hypothetical protein
MDEQSQTQDPQSSELEREERRLERLRLVTAQIWPQVDRYEDEPEGPAAA